ncbi:MAG: hypothetical protein DCC88_04785 [Spirobacillus cienkowskii]|jgi:hypothetical protein|uniref:Uncharacterized protein n=1 Tax=Spirobacillus cienkowskii TaxID=495820 RepID=A0A369KRT0_9BACT|nr:MAG: hypothetical protein DCC88_04785 [Spirobacillus cienkowskii]
MATLLKYVFLFFVFGLIWFMIFSIKVSKNATIFLVLQRELNTEPSRGDSANKKEIDRDRVIYAISKAFDE